MRRKLTSLSFFALFGLGAFAYGQTTGIVNDNNGFPEADAEVTVKGTSKTAFTDEDGKFDIDAKVGDVLLVNGKEFVVTSTDLGVLKLSDTVELEEAVITVAYGTQKKENVVGSNTVISAKDLENRAMTNVSQAIDGAAAGVRVSTSTGQPGAGLAIQIRGAGSYNLSNSPLYVVDGAIFTGNLSSINPNDIESLNILKDAASTSLYGSSAANGVVLITTKRGKRKGGVFNFSASMGVSTRGTKEYKRVNASEYYPMVWENLRNGYMSGKNAMDLQTANAAASNDLIKVLKTNVFNVSNESLVTEGILNPNASLIYDDFDWQKYTIRTGQREDYNFNYSGSDETTNYYTSFGYLKESGYLIASDYERYSTLSKIDKQVAPWLKLGGSISAALSKSNQAVNGVDSNSSFNNPYAWTRTMGPIYSPFAHDPITGDFLYDDNGEKIFDAGVNRGAKAAGGRNVIQETLKNRSYDEYSDINTRLYGDIDLAKGLKLNLNVSYNNRDAESLSYRNKFIGDGAPGGDMSLTKTTRQTLTLNQILNYNISFDQHNFEVLGGHESFEYKYKYSYAYKANQIVDDNYELINFIDTKANNSYSRLLRKESWFARMNYDFNSRYLVSASVRRDESSRFHKDNRAGVFWSAGLGWNIHRENFLATSTWVNQLKLRSSYGQVGNDGSTSTTPSYFAYASLFGLNYSNGADAGIFMTQVGNKDLTWESNNQFDVALEFGFLKNRISGSIEYFDRETKDLIFGVPQPLSAGIPDNEIFMNTATMKNSGFELALNLGIIRNQDLQWDVMFNATTYKNKITKMPEGIQTIDNGTKRIEKGHSIYDFYMRQWYGVDSNDGRGLFIADEEVYAKSKEKDNLDIYRMVDGQLMTTKSANAKYGYSGTANPDVYGSLSTNLSYKGFYLNAMFTYQFGGKVYDSNYASLMISNPEGQALHRDALQAWKKPGDVTNTPQLNSINGVDANAVSTRWLVSSDFISFRQATLGYTFSSDVLEKTGVSALKLFINAENIWSSVKRQGMEANQAFNGTTSNRYTPARIVSAGMNLSF